MKSHVLKLPKGGLGTCTSMIPKVRYKQYQHFCDQKIKDRKTQVIDEFMTTLTNWHDTAAAMLTNHWKKWWRPTPIDLSVASNQGGLQMTISVGIENGLTVPCWKWLLQTFSIARTYLIGLLSLTAFSRYWILQRLLVQDSLFQVGRKLGVSSFLLNLL